MLKQIFIKDFALFSEVTLTFEKGLTVLVGETGAGKSILIDALNAALGERSSSDVIRSGLKKAIVEVSFIDVDSEELRSIFLDDNLDWSDDQLIIRREITSSGGSRSFINDTPVQQSVIRSVGALLLDYHGQHETQGLFSPIGQRAILDGFAGVQELLHELSSAWTRLQTANRSHKELLASVSNAADEIERLQFGLKEITEVSPMVGEIESTLLELNRIEGQEVIARHATEAHQLLYSGDTSALSLIHDAKKALLGLAVFNPELNSFVPDLESAEITCNEIALAVSSLQVEVDYTPEYHEKLRLRLAALQRLARKHGSIEQAVETAEKNRQRVLDLSEIDKSLKAAESLVNSSRISALALATELNKIRSKKAVELQQSVCKTVAELGMKSADFSIEISQSELNESGCDSVQFLLSANIGENTKPLNKIASGGELSRVMLALKKAGADTQRRSTLVFDEIDTGVSGRVARQVGELMHKLSASHQILAISHLPQIASLADHVVRVEKFEENGRTEAIAVYVHGSDAEVEIAKLMSGAEVTESTIATARELIKSK
ncbi:MAG: DNA repair protein RecN [Ignavibacteria bacterium]|nr:DNA repair protein RecN [Ignavibacteria bacterium]